MKKGEVIMKKVLSMSDFESISDNARLFASKYDFSEYVKYLEEL